MNTSQIGVTLFLPVSFVHTLFPDFLDLAAAVR